MRYGLASPGRSAIARSKAAASALRPMPARTAAMISSLGPALLSAALACRSARASEGARAVADVGEDETRP